MLFLLRELVDELQCFLDLSQRRGGQNIIANNFEAASQFKDYSGLLLASLSLRTYGILFQIISGVERMI